MPSQKPKSNLSNTINWIALTCSLAALLVCLYYAPDLYRFFSSREKMMAFLNSHGKLSPVYFILLQIFQVLLAFIPGEITTLLGGFMYGTYYGLLYSTIGITIGSVMAFGFSKIVGRPFIEKIVPAKVIEKFDSYMDTKADVIFFYLFLIPGLPKDYLCFLLGLTPISFKLFLLISTVGRMLGIVLLTVQGNFLRNGQFKLFFIISGVVVAGFLIAHIYRDKLKKFIKAHNK